MAKGENWLWFHIFSPLYNHRQLFPRCRIYFIFYNHFALRRWLFWVIMRIFREMKVYFRIFLSAFMPPWAQRVVNSGIDFFRLLTQAEWREKHEKMMKKFSKSVNFIYSPRHLCNLLCLAVVEVWRETIDLGSIGAIAWAALCCVGQTHRRRSECEM